MSIELMTAVWKHSKQRGGNLLLLLALADYANEAGECWPAVQTLSKKTRITPRHVRRILRQLETAGEIVPSVRAGQHGTNCYVVTLGNTPPDIMSSGHRRPPPLTPASVPPDAGVIQSVSNRHEPSERAKEPELKLELLEQPIDVISPEVIYDAYPKKKNRPKGIAAIVRAMRKIPPVKLLAAVNLFAEMTRKWPPGDDVYIPYPASWFNAEAWLDDPKTWERNSNDKTNRAGTSRALGANSNLDAFDSFEKRLATGA